MKQSDRDYAWVAAERSLRHILMTPESINPASLKNEALALLNGKVQGAAGRFSAIEAPAEEGIL
jgi:hypothetical protein